MCGGGQYGGSAHQKQERGCGWGAKRAPCEETGHAHAGHGGRGWLGARFGYDVVWSGWVCLPATHHVRSAPPTWWATKYVRPCTTKLPLVCTHDALVRAFTRWDWGGTAGEGRPWSRHSTSTTAKGTSSRAPSGPRPPGCPTSVAHGTSTFPWNRGENGCRPRWGRGASSHRVVPDWAGESRAHDPGPPSMSKGLGAWLGSPWPCTNCFHWRTTGQADTAAPARPHSTHTHPSINTLEERNASADDEEET